MGPLYFFGPLISNNAHSSELKLVGFNVLFDSVYLLYAVLAPSVRMSYESCLIQSNFLFATICTDGSQTSLTLMLGFSKSELSAADHALLFDISLNIRLIFGEILKHRLLLNLIIKSTKANAQKLFRLDHMPHSSRSLSLGSSSKAAEAASSPSSKMKALSWISI